MPFTITWEKRGAVTSYYGIVDFHEVFEADRHFNSDPRSDNARYQIIDFTQATPGVVDEDEIKYIAAMDYGASLSIHRLNLALVAIDPYIRKLCNQYINKCMKKNMTWKFMLFEDMESARIWAAS